MADDCWGREEEFVKADLMVVRLVGTYLQVPSMCDLPRVLVGPRINIMSLWRASSKIGSTSRAKQTENRRNLGNTNPLGPSPDRRVTDTRLVCHSDLAFERVKK